MLVFWTSSFIYLSIKCLSVITNDVSVYYDDITSEKRLKKKSHTHTHTHTHMHDKQIRTWKYRYTVSAIDKPLNNKKLSLFCKVTLEMFFL